MRSNNGGHVTQQTCSRNSIFADLSSGRYEPAVLDFTSVNRLECIAQLIIEKGAEVSTYDVYWKTMLQYTSERGHNDVVQLLQPEADTLKEPSGKFLQNPSELAECLWFNI